MKYYLISILLFSLISCSTFNIRNKKNDKVLFSLEVKQIVYTSFTQNTYVIKEGKLFIYEQSISKKGKRKIKKIYSKRIKEGKYEKIKNLSLNLYKLDSKYVKSMLDGIRWELTYIDDNGNTKKVILDNYALDKVNELFEVINTNIPKKEIPICIMDLD